MEEAENTMAAKTEGPRPRMRGGAGGEAAGAGTEAGAPPGGPGLDGELLTLGAASLNRASARRWKPPDGGLEAVEAAGFVLASALRDGALAVPGRDEAGRPGPRDAAGGVDAALRDCLAGGAVGGPGESMNRSSSLRGARKAKRRRALVVTGVSSGTTIILGPCDPSRKASPQSMSAG